MTTPKGQLSRRELGTWMRFVAGSRSLFQSLDRRLRDDAGLSHDDFVVLAAIRRSSETRMSDLADEVSFSLSRLTHVIQRMEGHGWVERKATTEDKRVRILSLTPLGEEVLAQAWPPHADAIRELFLGQLTDEDRRAFDDAFTRIRRAAAPKGTPQ